MPRKTARFTFLATPQFVADLNAVAEAYDKSVSEVVRDVLADYLRETGFYTEPKPRPRPKKASRKQA